MERLIYRVHSLCFFAQDLCFRAVKGINKMEEIFHILSYEEGCAEFSKKKPTQTSNNNKSPQKPTHMQIPHTCKTFEGKEALDQRPYVGEGNTPLFHPGIVASLLWAEGLHPCDRSISSHSADVFFFFFFQMRISKLLCCPALSALPSFAWQKYVMFVVNVLDYYLVLVLKQDLVPRYDDSS